MLLHGGPACTHEYMECFESFFPKEGFEFYEYDQLGSYYSDQPKDERLWALDRFVDEVEQVRQQLGLDSSNFYLLGHSWGGVLAMEYALTYPQNLKALIVADMMASCSDYGRYAQDTLSKGFASEVLAEIRDIEAHGDFQNPRYMELLLPHFYQKHVCRLQEWPEPIMRSFKHTNNEIYTLMQGPSEFGISGLLESWDRKARLGEIKVPTLMIGAKYDTMDPKAIEEQSRLVQKGRYLFCENGSHLCMYDDQKTFMEGLIQFIKDADTSP